jgi:hypothetical protein
VCVCVFVFVFFCVCVCVFFFFFLFIFSSADEKEEDLSVNTTVVSRFLRSSHLWHLYFLAAKWKCWYINIAASEACVHQMDVWGVILISVNEGFN